MPTRGQYDASPLASQICGGHFRQTDKRVNRRPHGLHDWAMAYTLAGSGRFVGTDKNPGTLVTRPGLLVLVSPGTPTSYEVGTHARWDHLWLHFLARPHWVEWLNWPVHSTGTRILFVPAGLVRRKVLSTFRRIIRLTVSPAADREQFALNALEEMLLWCARVKPQPDTPASDPLIQDCLEYISENMERVITLADLARLSKQSVSRLTHQFRQQTGLSPMQYIEQRRLERAMELLSRTAMSVKDIAVAVGFENPFYFTLRFHKHTGFSPRTFRNQAGHPTNILRRPGIRLNSTDRELLRRKKLSEKLGIVERLK